MLNEFWSALAGNAIATTAQNTQSAIIECVERYGRPSAIMRPKLSIDGNQWCALYGDNLQDGVAGFGNSPADAVWDFDRNWAAPLESKERTEWAAASQQEGV